MFDFFNCCQSRETQLQQSKFESTYIVKQKVYPAEERVRVSSKLSMKKSFENSTQPIASKQQLPPFHRRMVTGSIQQSRPIYTEQFIVNTQTTHDDIRQKIRAKQIAIEQLRLENFHLKKIIQQQLIPLESDYLRLLHQYRSKELTIQNMEIQIQRLEKQQ